MHDYSDMSPEDLVMSRPQEASDYTPESAEQHRYGRPDYVATTGPVCKPLTDRQLLEAKLRELAQRLEALERECPQLVSGAFYADASDAERQKMWAREKLESFQERVVTALARLDARERAAITTTHTTERVA
jgi:hypothetical protein